ncbi:biotin/lipoyl-binding protein [uncultured Campylobacter sp.]|uniref:HlyD family secretion protein n=1 Tax=uncultured Campylobacter sp. TaxID=218934 RepID=UPI003211B240
MGLNLSKFYAFFAFFILIFAGCADEKGSAFFNGYVEGDYLYVAPSVSGRIVNLSVKEGTAVQEGESLFVLDSAEALANLDAAKANVSALEAELADLSTGKRPEEIERISAELKQAKAAFWIAEANYDRAKSLLTKHAVSQKDFDAAKAEFDRANALVSELNAALKVANLPARSERITSLKAKIKAAKASGRAAQWRLEQTAVLAPKSGLIEDIFYKTGEFVQSSQPVLSLLPPSEVKIRFSCPQARCLACARDKKHALAARGARTLAPAS